MKGYYKNWYQHYLKLEEEKEKEVQRGYYSNLAPKESQDKVKNQAPEGLQEEKSEISEIRTIVPVKKKKKKRVSFFNILLPVALISGFSFLWYQMDIGSTRQLVDEALVFVGVREKTIDVVSYHTSLLDQHVEFAEKVAAYINGEGEISFDDLELIYDEIRAMHMRVIEVSEEEHEEVIRLWLFKISSTHQMMNDLVSDEDAEVAAINIDAAHSQFVIDQREIAALIRAELMIGEDL